MPKWSHKSHRGKKTVPKVFGNAMLFRAHRAALQASETGAHALSNARAISRVAQRRGAAHSSQPRRVQPILPAAVFNRLPFLPIVKPLFPTGQNAWIHPLLPPELLLPGLRVPSNAPEIQSEICKKSESLIRRRIRRLKLREARERQNQNRADQVRSSTTIRVHLDHSRSSHHGPTIPYRKPPIIEESKPVDSSDDETEVDCLVG